MHRIRREYHEDDTVFIAITNPLHVEVISRGSYTQELWVERPEVVHGILVIILCSMFLGPANKERL